MKAGRGISAETCGLDDVFPPDDLGSDQGLSYDHSQHMQRRLLELDILEIKMGTAVIINNLWSILNNNTANIDIALTHCPIFLTADLYLCNSNCSSTKFNDNFTKVMGMVKKYKEDIGIIYMNQELRCVL